VYFCSSGSEGVEAAIKFARAHTDRPNPLSRRRIPGLTYGALSLMDNPFWTAEFGPPLPDTHAAPFGDLDRLSEQLASKRFAAFVVEPIQAEAGVVMPPQDYLREAERLCQKYHTL
jgi:ornithine--oxo-acid transaminase